MISAESNICEMSSLQKANDENGNGSESSEWLENSSRMRREEGVARALQPRTWCDDDDDRRGENSMVLRRKLRVYNSVHMYPV